MAHQPAELAILGLLRLNGGSAYGYELMRRFLAPDPLAGIIHLSQPMLYQHLKKLARLAWIEIETEQQTARPPRQICRLTETGREELDRWLGEPVAHTREIRLDFLVKLYIAQLLVPGRIVALIDDQLVAVQRWRDSLAAQLAGAGDDPTQVRRLVLSLRLAQTETALAWLASARQTLAS
jgi:DNA-binding PadR family transcriptional regulator